MVQQVREVLERLREAFQKRDWRREEYQGGS